MSDITASIQERRESPSGTHYSMLYDSCQRRFHFLYNLGLRTKWTDKALIFGGAFHEAKAAYYQTGKIDDAIDKGVQEITNRATEFIGPEDYEFSRGRITPMLVSWYKTYGKDDFKNYDVVAVEEEFRIPIPFTNDYVLTQRHDALLRRKADKKIYTMETKTSSSSIDFTLESVRSSAQVVGYNWGGQQVFGAEYGGLIIDVTYFSSRSTNPDTIKNQRSEPINKGIWDVKKLQIDMAMRFNEIEAKQRSLSTGVPAEFLYRANQHYCHAYWRPCPYINICAMSDRDALTKLPDSLEREESEKVLDGMTYDVLFFGEA